GVMARGDRRLCAVIEAAWRRGARFDGWDECYDDAIWRAAYAETGVDPAWYAHRERPFDERLPWDHVGLRIGREYLVKSYDDVYARIGVRKPPPAVHQRRAPIPAGSSERVRSPALPVLTT